MTEKMDLQKWLATAAMVLLSLVIVLLPSAGADPNRWEIPVIVIHMALPVAAAITGALCFWPVTGALCILTAAAGWKVFPAEALPVTLFWCAASGLTACIPIRRKLLRPALRAGMCLAAWSIGLLILLQATGGQIVNGLAQAICGAVDRSPDSTEILLRAFSAGYIRLKGVSALMPAAQMLGTVTIPVEIRVQMLFSLRVSLEEILPSLICSTIIYHTTLTVLLSTVLPDWQRRKRGEAGEFSPMEQWYMPRRMGAAVFALCIGWVIALMAQEGIGAYLGWMCAGVFRVAFILQGICWMQWMGKRMGVRSAARNVWSVILSIVMPLIPMIMGMIDQRRDARHLRPEEEADQE
ncbi:MAG: DUF2232 domain-containing protein [Clostridia bacterium]|nr:DUF2232 domain-containing protein [Clostridia bacterium]